MMAETVAEKSAESPPAHQQPTTVVSTSSKQDDNDSESTYHLKWIPWNSGKIPIVMQSINGPCPLIATMNVLLLREKVKLPSMLEQITASQLLTYIGECIMDSVPADLETDENAMLNLEQNIHDAMEILPKLKTGLDVNIRFTGIIDFEYTPECIIFDLLRIPLYHGWLSDPSLTELQNAIGNQSYNQLVDNIITNKSSQDPDVLTNVLIAEEFLEKTASQLTLHGLHELKSRIKDNEIGILFRNNHFLTFFKRESEIYTLVTDHGYLTEDNIVWETLDNIEGAGRFFDSNFHVAETTNRQVSEFNAIDQRQQQLENDFFMALSLKEEMALERESDNDPEKAGPSSASARAQEDDFELAKRLQAEEDRIYEEMVRERQASEQRLDIVERRNCTKPIAVTDRVNVPGIQQVDTTTNQPVNNSGNQQGPVAGEVPRMANYTQLDFPPLTELQNPENFPAPQSQQQSPTKPNQQPDQQQQQEQPPIVSSSSGIYNQEIVNQTSRPHDDLPIPSSHQRPANGRRYRSEKSSKDSNCVVS